MDSCCLYRDEWSCDWFRLYLEISGKDELEQYGDPHLLQLGQHVTYRLSPFVNNSSTCWPDQQHKIPKTSREGFCTVGIAENCINFKCQTSMN